MWSLVRVTCKQYEKYLRIPIISLGEWKFLQYFIYSFLSLIYLSYHGLVGNRCEYKIMCFSFRQQSHTQASSAVGAKTIIRLYAYMCSRIQERLTRFVNMYKEDFENIQQKQRPSSYIWGFLYLLFWKCKFSRFIGRGPRTHMRKLLIIFKIQQNKSFKLCTKFVPNRRNKFICKLVFRKKKNKLSKHDHVIKGVAKVNTSRKTNWPTTQQTWIPRLHRQQESRHFVIWKRTNQQIIGHIRFLSYSI